MSLRKYSVYAVFALVTTIAGQSALASPCNKHFFEQTIIKCAGNTDCIQRIYIQAMGNSMNYWQCKTDQYNQQTGANKTVGEYMKPVLGGFSEPVKGQRRSDQKYTYGNREAEIRAQGRRGSLSKSTQERDNSGKYREQIDDMTKVIATRPKYAAQAYHNRALAKLELKDYHGAIDDYSKAISINPRDAVAYLSRGIANELVGDINGACADWGRASSMGVKNGTRWVSEQC